MNDILWRGMTRTELDVAYDNRGAVKNSAAKVAVAIRMAPLKRAV